MFCIALTNASLPAKRRILTVCVKLFLEKGYKRTTMSEIVQKANVSYSSFQNIFRAKDGVLVELVEFMFSNQFTSARAVAGKNLPPIYIYAVETCIQLTLTELNENLREIYVESYTHKEALDYITHHTTKELETIFASYLPEHTSDDFYAMEIGSSGLMRGFMVQPCSETFSLENKLRCFLTMSLSAYQVPKEEQEQVIQFIENMDIRKVSEQVMYKLFQSLAMRFDFSLSEKDMPKLPD